MVAFLDEADACKLAEHMLLAVERLKDEAGFLLGHRVDWESHEMVMALMAKVLSEISPEPVTIRPHDGSRTLAMEMVTDRMLRSVVKSGI